LLPRLLQSSYGWCPSGAGRRSLTSPVCHDELAQLIEKTGAFSEVTHHVSRP
jgi:hypothetical protein